MGSLSPQLAPVAEIWRVKDGSFSRIFGLLYRKIPKIGTQILIRSSYFSALEALVGPVMILVQDIGDIYKLTEADFEISIFLEFYGRFQVKIWPFSGF